MSLRIRKGKSCRYNEYLVEISSKVLQHPHLTYFKNMKYTLFEEPSGRSGIKKSFINLKKKIRFKIRFELWV